MDAKDEIVPSARCNYSTTTSDPTQLPVRSRNWWKLTVKFLNIHFTVQTYSHGFSHVWINQRLTGRQVLWDQPPSGNICALLVRCLSSFTIRERKEKIITTLGKIYNKRSELDRKIIWAVPCKFFFIQKAVFIFDWEQCQLQKMYSNGNSVK